MPICFPLLRTGEKYKNTAPPPSRSLPLYLSSSPNGSGKNQAHVLQRKNQQRKNQQSGEVELMTCAQLSAEPHVPLVFLSPPPPSPSALTRIRQLEWKPRGRGSTAGKSRGVLTLFRLCLDLLAENFDHVESLGCACKLSFFSLCCTPW